MLLAAVFFVARTTTQRPEATTRWRWAIYITSHAQGSQAMNLLASPLTAHSRWNFAFLSLARRYPTRLAGTSLHCFPRSCVLNVQCKPYKYHQVVWPVMNNKRPSSSSHFAASNAGSPNFGLTLRGRLLRLDLFLLALYSSLRWSPKSCEAFVCA